MELGLLSAAFSIIVINLVLSGDNALLIALATRNLSIEFRRKAVFWGIIGAVGLRIILTFLIVYLLAIPYVRGIGGSLLIWIAVKLITDHNHEAVKQDPENLSQAIRTIILADFLMSLDNVLGVAAASNGNLPLLVFGLVMSIPIVVFGSRLIQSLLKRWPITIYLGAAILGWTGGEMISNDLRLLEELPYLIPAFCGILVITAGMIIQRIRGDDN